MTKIVNLISGPGVGKSTGAAHIFSQLKMNTNIKIELIHEYAKYLTYAGRQQHLKEQDYVYSKQKHMMEACHGKVDYIITDSPLILSLAYLPDTFPKSFRQFAVDMFNTFDNINFFLKRIKPYQPYGRNQNEQEAIYIDNKIYKILLDNQIPFNIVEGGEDGYKKIIEFIVKDLGVYY